MRDDLTVDEIVNRNIVTDLWTVQKLKNDMSKLSEQTTKDKVTDAYLYREVYGEDDDNTPGQTTPTEPINSPFHGGAEDGPGNNGGDLDDLD